MSYLGDWITRMRNRAGLPEIPVNSAGHRFMSNCVIDENDVGFDNILKYVGEANIVTCDELDCYNAAIKRDPRLRDKSYVDEQLAKYLGGSDGDSEDISDEEIAEAERHLNESIAYNNTLENVLATRNGFTTSSAKRNGFSERKFDLLSNGFNVSSNERTLARELEVATVTSKSLNAKIEQVEDAMSKLYHLICSSISDEREMKRDADEFAKIQNEVLKQMNVFLGRLFPTLVSKKGYSRMSAFEHSSANENAMTEEINCKVNQLALLSNDVKILSDKNFNLRGKKMELRARDEKLQELLSYFRKLNKGDRTLMDFRIATIDNSEKMALLEQELEDHLSRRREEDERNNWLTQMADCSVRAQIGEKKSVLRRLGQLDTALADYVCWCSLYFSLTKNATKNVLHSILAYYDTSEYLSERFLTHQSIMAEASNKLIEYASLRENNEKNACQTSSRPVEWFNECTFNKFEKLARELEKKMSSASLRGVFRTIDYGELRKIDAQRDELLQLARTYVNVARDANADERKRFLKSLWVTFLTDKSKLKKDLAVLKNDGCDTTKSSSCSSTLNTT